MIIRVTDVPVSKRGKEATKETVAIRENGQIGFNSLLAKNKLEGVTHCLIDWDSKKRNLSFYLKAPKGFDLQRDGFEIKTSESNKTKSVSAAGLLNHESFQYNYKELGNQVFDVEDITNGFMIHIDEDLKPAEKVARPRKAKGSKEEVKEPEMVAAE